MFDLAAITIGLHLQSIHLPDRPWMNNQNYGIYALVDDIGVGVYKNTRRKTSAWIGYNIAPQSFKLGSIDLDCHVGFISGYDSSVVRYIAEDGTARKATNLQRYKVFIAPSANMSLYKNVSGRLTVLPGVVHTQIEYKWK